MTVALILVGIWAVVFLICLALLVVFRAKRKKTPADEYEPPWPEVPFEDPSISVNPGLNSGDKGYSTVNGSKMMPNASPDTGSPMNLNQNTPQTLMMPTAMADGQKAPVPKKIRFTGKVQGPNNESP